LSRKKPKNQKRKAKGRNRLRQAREARRKKRPSQSAIVLKQKQDEARKAMRITRDLRSPFSPEKLMEDFGIPTNTNKIKLE